MTLQEWLKTQLETLVGVQRCSLRRATSAAQRTNEPDLTVYMWTGVHIHIYHVVEEIKTRSLKSIIQADSGVGVSSLFIVAPHLLPAANNVLRPAEWLVAIHALTGERIYTYQPLDGAFRVFQLHFESTGMMDEYRVLTSPPIIIQQIRYSRITVKPRAIKGFWMVADFGLDVFWKKDTGRFQTPPRPQYSASSTSSAPRQPPQPAPTPPRSRLELSFELLGLTLSASREETRRAFRKQAFAVHPDVSPLDKAEAEARFKALSEAYEYIKSEKGW